MRQVTHMGGEPIVVRRGEHGWQIGDEQAADLSPRHARSSASSSLIPAGNLFGHSK